MSNSKKFGTFFLTLICISAAFNLRNLPMIAQYGIASVLLYPLLAFCFLVPCGFACAELSSGWPKAGGMYSWIKEAFGYKLGFLAVWLDWIINLIWFPIVLSFIVGTLAYLIEPDLANNKSFMCFTMLSFLWLITFINFFGIHFSGRLSSITALIGSLVPGFLLIFIGSAYFINNKIQAIANLMQPLGKHSIAYYSYISGMILSFAGIEAAGLIGHSSQDLKQNYPRAIFISICIIISVSLLGSLAIACVISPREINLISSFIETFQKYSKLTGLLWLAPIIAFLTIIGSVSSTNTWVACPTKSLMVAVIDNQLPKILQYKNKKNSPITLLLIQAISSTILISVFLWMPTVNASYWLLSALTSQLTLIMYILLFLSVITLRKSQPDIKREHPIPGGKLGAYFICGLGIITCLAAIVIGFIPPEQLGKLNIKSYELFLISGLLFSLSPILFFNKKNKFETNTLPDSIS
ncbi:MAG: amino acid permease [Gammaproteobacteria bacterium]|nr:amino acid permease [Gammaproteobacteria bacterium]